MSSRRIPRIVARIFCAARVLPFMRCLPFCIVQKGRFRRFVQQEHLMWMNEISISEKRPSCGRPGRTPDMRIGNLVFGVQQRDQLFSCMFRSVGTLNKVFRHTCFSLGPLAS